MNFGYAPYNFELIYRPLYEMRICLCWCLCAVLTLYVGGTRMELPDGIVRMQCGVCLGMALVFFVKGFGVWQMQRRLFGAKLEFVPLDKFIVKTRPYVQEDKFWLGEGFDWTPEQTQRCYEILKLRWAEISRYEPLHSQLVRRLDSAAKAASRCGEILREKGGTMSHAPLRIPAQCAAAVAGFMRKLRPPENMGQRWIHGLSDQLRPIEVPASWFNGHLLILGTTGSGKTRLADLLNTQIIMRGEALVIIDPKGDVELRDNARRACDAYRKWCLETGRPDPGERFFFFHPAFPEESVRLNLLANSARDTDVSTRITNLIPSQSAGGFDPFTAFGWMSVNAIVQALLYTGQNPTIALIRRHLLDSMQELTRDAVRAFCRREDARLQNEGMLSRRPFDDLLSAEIHRFRRGVTAEQEVTLMCDIFSAYYVNAPDAGNIASLVKIFKHPREHFQKMVNNMLPLLDMLTAGTLGTLLSMTPGDDPLMEHRTLNTLDILDRRGVLYIGLDSLSDKMVGTAIGSLALSDIAASAGTLYNYRSDRPPVSIFVDEASECVNDSFIQLLNKGRGAGMRIMVATQTVSDFVAAMGSSAKEEMVLGNVNSVIALRTRNPTSQKFLCEDLPETVIRTLTHSQGISSLTTAPLLHGASQSEMLKETTAPLVPQQIFGLLPNLEYIAIFAGGTVVKGRLPIIGSPPKKKRRKARKAEDMRDYAVGLDIDRETPPGEGAA